MRIVGKAQTGFLVDISEDEIIKLMGYYSVYSDEWKKQNIEIKPGLVFSITDEFNKLYWLRRRNSDFNQLINKLHETAEAIKAERVRIDLIVDGMSNP
ncbi:hypothetical protein KGP36_06800 [Patescibacteria group bacterium]|nr:hypothetical protein [Patescibacteria group bacterium]